MYCINEDGSFHGMLFFYRVLYNVAYLVLSLLSDNLFTFNHTNIFYIVPWNYKSYYILWFIILYYITLSYLTLSLYIYHYIIILYYHPILNFHDRPELTLPESFCITLCEKKCLVSCTTL